MPALLARLAAVCRDNLLREKILVVPSLAIGHQIADAIAHGTAALPGHLRQPLDLGGHARYRTLHAFGGLAERATMLSFPTN